VENHTDYFIWFPTDRVSISNCEASYVRALVQPCATKLYDVHGLCRQPVFPYRPSIRIYFVSFAFLKISCDWDNSFVQLLLLTASQKTRHQTLSHNFTNYYPIFKFFSLKDSVVNLQQTPFKNSTTLETCRYTTLWNINVTKWHHSEIRIAINDDSQGSIAKNLRCDE